MRYCIMFLTIINLFCPGIKAQELPKDFKRIIVNKKVKEYENKYSLKTPLESFITYTNLNIKGNKGMFRAVSSQRIKRAFAKPGAPDSKVTEEEKEGLLNTTIKEIIVYKDSVAGVINDYYGPRYIIRYLSLENGEWLNAGENWGGDNLSEAGNTFIENSIEYLTCLHRIAKFSEVPRDTLPFIDYLAKYGQEPSQFILNSLAAHKIVIYGELHMRKSSWELLKKTIQEPAFHKTVGTVFMELSSDKQDELNRFFKSSELETEILLNVFRNITSFGFHDRGMYEFIIEIWKLNKSLPEGEKIKVVAVDMPRPYDSLKNIEEYKKFFNNVKDRNEIMADIIEKTIKSESSKKNYLFTVGFAHAFKSQVPGIASSNGSNKPKLSAAAQLCERFSKADVFSIFPHCPIIDNRGTVYGKIRNGLFDYVISKYNNKPVAFNLRNSPFGKEPFDGIYEISYDNLAGSYENNYDGYIYLESPETEPAAYFLYDMYSDDYIKEMNRRAAMLNIKVTFGKEEQISKLKAIEQKARWKDALID